MRGSAQALPRPPSIGSADAASGLRRAFSHAGAGRRLSGPHRENRRSLSGRRNGRCGSPDCRRLAVTQMEPAGRHREPHGRRRKHRLRTGLPFGAGRLHPALVTAAAACDQSQPVPEARLRSDEIRADHRDGAGAECADRQSEQRQGIERARVDRISAGQFRQDHLRHARQRHHLASDLGAVSADGQGEAAAHSLSRLGAGAAGPCSPATST